MTDDDTLRDAIARISAAPERRSAANEYERKDGLVYFYSDGRLTMVMNEAVFDVLLAQAQPK